MVKREGLSRSTIGWAGLIFAVYAFNYLWAPLIDKIRIPILTKKFGHRRSWIILMQLIILISLALWSLMEPSKNLTLVIFVGLIIAIASSTQDITVDALRIEQVGEKETKSMAAGAAMAVVGWWSGYKLGGVISLFSAETLQNLGFENYWQITFLLLILLVVLMNIGLLLSMRKKISKEQINKKSQRAIQDKIGSTGLHAKVIAWISETVGGPVISFFKKMVLILLSEF